MDETNTSLIVVGSDWTKSATASVWSFRFIRTSPSLVVVDPGIIAKWIWLEIAAKGNGSMRVVLSSGDVVVAFVCASSSAVLISFACVFMSVTKLTKVGVMSWGVRCVYCSVFDW